jgi:hypothetical protein
MQAGILFSPGAFWIDAHWSTHNRRWCINVLSGVTFWITLPGGQVPERARR